ncbi:Adenylate cyclase [[Candida] zeylanoides]
MSFLKRDKARPAETAPDGYFALQGDADKPLSPTSAAPPGPPRHVHDDGRVAPAPTSRAVDPEQLSMYLRKPFGPTRRATSPPTDGVYSPRSSIVSANAGASGRSAAATDCPSDADAPVDAPHGIRSQLKDNYKGFHGGSRNKGLTVPPLTQPIKPRFKKKSGSLLGKLIYSRRESDADADEAPQRSYSLGAPHKHKFRLPSISLDHHDASSSSSQRSSVPEVEVPPTVPEASEAEAPGAHKPSLGRAGTQFNLDMDLNEMRGIVKPEATSASSSPRPSLVPSGSQGSVASARAEPPAPAAPAAAAPGSAPALRKSFSTANLDAKASWKAPDSWDVNLDAERDEVDEVDESSASSDTSDTEPAPADSGESAGAPAAAPAAAASAVGSTGLDPFRDHLPVLYGMRQPAATRGPNHIIRIFRQDNTFATILCPLETTAAELLTIVQRKFFLDSVANYQISVHIGSSVKVLEAFERPLKIQMGLLLLSGYTRDDALYKIGREDLSSVCKFVLEDMHLRNLTHEEEVVLSRDYVDVDISGLNLKNIPIIFHQHTYEIERLNVADNPSIYIPLDFLQSCNNLTGIVFSRNGCSRFPLNFLEARHLTSLDMQKNFLDELPARFGHHLRHLTVLRLNSNQLSSLPRSFGRLQHLRSLNLSSNYFRHYPEAVSDLGGLVDLDLSYNDLSELPPSMGRLTALAKLNLSTNKLARSLPSHFTQLRSLKRLDIRYNAISNIDVLGSLPSLEVAYASKNNISGFSDRMENLRLLHFDRNPITDLQFENLLPILTVLDLSKAKLTSVPPDFVAKIPNIEKLVLDKNHLVNLPDAVGDLPKLAYLSIHNNNLQVLPHTIGRLAALQYLDLHANNLQVLPDAIWDLRSLAVLNVSSNMLTNVPKPPLAVAKRISSSINFRSLMSEATGGAGSPERRESVAPSAAEAPSPPVTAPAPTASEASAAAPAEAASLADSLLVLTLADNRLNDEVFESLSFLAELKSLNLSYNFLLEIPEGAVRRMTKLAELFLSGNELTSLPTDDLENLKSLKTLHLNNNKLVSLPAELSKLTSLQTLDVGSNQLKYNISNWPYDWNWHWNMALKYLNFSGNKRFEIKQSHIKNPETGEDFDSLLVLKNLKVLGLIDVTLTTSSLPDQSTEMRIRTTASELDNVGYGVSDSMGSRDCVSSRDIFIQKFRGNEGEVLICSFDGKMGTPTHGHRVSAAAKAIFVPNFTAELNKLEPGEPVQRALRRAFLSMNREINGHFAALLSADDEAAAKPAAGTASTVQALTLRDDASAGCSATIVYIRDKTVYTANTGDVEALLCRHNANHVLLTTKHDPTTRSEFERIRASGGYVSGDGTLDGDLSVSRGVGFFNYLPHTHSGPDITQVELSAGRSGGVEMIVIATRVLWDYITYELAVDILRQEKNDPMRAAQKLRDYALGYGATDKINVMILTLGDQHHHDALASPLAARSKYGTALAKGSAGKKRRDRNNPLQGAGDSTLRRLEEEIDPPVGELALVFTDIKNSTLLWDAYPVAMRSAIKIHNAIMRRQLRIVGGYEVKTEGDAFMVSFPSPSSALLWCFNVQQQLITADWPTEILTTDTCREVAGADGVIFRGLSVRMGIHWGSPVYELDVVTRRMDYFGPMVNRTSRINAVADGGQIAVSSDFLKEIGALTEIHRSIAAHKTTLEEAYEGNVAVGEIIERELSQLDEIGCVFYEVGERKLKGLETPELITLAYPRRLKERYQVFCDKMEAEEAGTAAAATPGSKLGGLGGFLESRVVAQLPVDCIYGLRSISLRLENISIFLSDGAAPHDSFKNTSSSKISESINFQENDIIAMLNHIVSRVESNVATFQLRQELNRLRGGEGVMSPVPQSIWEVVDELKAAVAGGERASEPASEPAS